VTTETDCGFFSIGVAVLVAVALVLAAMVGAGPHGLSCGALLALAFTVMVSSAAKAAPLVRDKATKTASWRFAVFTVLKSVEKLRVLAIELSLNKDC
jgi:hypothetical protein